MNAILQTQPNRRKLNREHLKHRALVVGARMEEALERVAVQLALGDVVRFNRGEYAHVAIYIGRGKVVHLWSPSERDFQVRIDTLRRVQLSAQHPDAAHYHEYAALTALPECYSDEMDAKMFADHQLEPLSGDEVVQRAMEKLGETKYDCLSYNCEHFVTWARYGFGASPQVTSHTNHVLAGALLGAVVGGIAGFVVGGICSLLLKKDALAASAGISTGATLTSASAAHEEDHTRTIRSGTSSSIEFGASSGLTDSSDSEHDSSSDGNDSDAMRAAERARLWADLEIIRPSDVPSAELSALDEWVEARRRHAAAASARLYSNDRHTALATRLAEDDLQCGYAFALSHCTGMNSID